MTRARALLLACALALPVGVQAIDLRPSGGTYSLRVTSLKEARYRTTIPQRYDFSCGSAATATLLTYHFGHAVTEEEVFRAMFATGDQARIRKEGFSLLDMRRYLTAQGYQADGFELPLEKLAQEGLPAIVLLNDRGYRHFVVVKGVQDGRVLLGDPARGTRAMSREKFESLWQDRVLFVVHNRRELAQFNTARDWRTAPAAPLHAGISRQGLQNVVMPRRGPGDI